MMHLVVMAIGKRCRLSEMTFRRQTTLVLIVGFLFEIVATKSRAVNRGEFALSHKTTDHPAEIQTQGMGLWYQAPGPRSHKRLLQHSEITTMCTVQMYKQNVVNNDSYCCIYPKLLSLCCHFELV